MGKRKLLIAEKSDCQNILMEMVYNKAPQKIVSHKAPSDPTKVTHTINFMFKDRIDAKTFQLPRILQKEFSLSDRIFDYAKSKQTIEFYVRNATIDSEVIRKNSIAEILKKKKAQLEKQKLNT